MKIQTVNKEEPTKIHINTNINEKFYKKKLV